MKLANVGYGNMVASTRVLAVVSPDAAPIRRLVQDAREAGRLIDATCGRKTRSVLVMDTGHVVLSPLESASMAARLDGEKPPQKDIEGDEE